MPTVSDFVLSVFFKCNGEVGFEHNLEVRLANDNPLAETCYFCLV